MIELYKHNKETYLCVNEKFQDNNRVAVVQPTGTGKSFLVLKFIDDSICSKTLILSPSTAIFSQLKRYAEETNDCHILENCTMWTYSKMLTLTDDEIKDLKFDNIIIDELHRLGADEWGVKVQLLLDSNPDAKILGLTATPVRYLDGCRDMTDEFFYGNIAREMTLGEAVVEGILPVPTYIPVYTDEIDQEFLDSNIDNSLKEQYRQLFRHMENSYGVQKILKKYVPSNGKFIVFCRNSEHLKLMKNTVTRWFHECNFKVHKYTSISIQSDKDIQLNKFIDDDSECIRLLFSIDRFNEGLHVPDIDGVIMLRQTESPTIYLQQIGRALSSKKDKSPLVFDFVNNYANVTIRENGKESINVFENEIRSIVKNKKDLDDSIFEVFEHALEFIEIQNQIDLLYDTETRWNSTFELYKEFKQEFNREPKTIEFYKDIKIGIWVNRQKQNYRKNKLSEEKIKLLEEVGFVFDYIDDLQWNSNFELYKEFKQEFNRDPKNGEIYKDIKIGNWIIRQRLYYNQNKLSQEKIKFLKEVGFVFDVIDELQWNSNFELYKQFKQEFNRDPSVREIYKDINLGQWINIQKMKYRQGKISQDKIKLLEETGLIFDNLFDLQWNSTFELYKEFKQEFNRDPKYGEIYKDIYLGRWINTQKQRYKKGKLSQERIKLLEETGFKF